MFIVLYIPLLKYILEKKLHFFPFFSPRFSLKYYLLNNLNNFAPNYKFYLLMYKINQFVNILKTIKKLSFSSSY